MELKELKKIQTDFSKSRDWHWHHADNEEELITHLKYMAVAIAGEVGEFANLVKKVMRQKEEMNVSMKDHMKEEITDIFIYCLLISNLLDMDLETEYFKKLEKNKQRFPAKE